MMILALHLRIHLVAYLEFSIGGFIYTYAIMSMCRH